MFNKDENKSIIIGKNPKIIDQSKASGSSSGGITTKDVSSVIKGSHQDSIEVVFADKPYIANVLGGQNISSIFQLPKTIEELKKIKGIGNSSAETILERIK